MSKADADRIGLVSRLVIHYWVLRSRMVRKLRIYVQAYIDQNIQSECLYCRSQYGLRVELMENLEDVFYDFLTESHSTIGDFNYQQWQLYFRRHSTYRTTCYNCHEKIEVAHRKRRREVRHREKILAKRSKEYEEIMQLTNEQRKKFFEHIYSRSSRAHEIIGLWVAQARLAVILKDDVLKRNELLMKRYKRQVQLRKQKMSESFIERQLDREGLAIPK